ncbi:MAG: molybdopterin-dependent oxidoreductase [Desulfobacterales bacterium]|nr:molybdopterin-dependent oxidoreductase [Desulfobacterales bacterium]
MTDFQWVGQRVPKVDALIKATGAAKFTNDISFPDMLTGKLVRSPYPHARILNIDTRRAKRLRGVKAVITGKDTPGVKYGVFPDSRDQYLLAVDKVRYIGEEVAAVAAVDEETAQEAIDLIAVDYEPLVPVFDPQEALQPAAPVIHVHAPNNISTEMFVKHGAVEKGLENSRFQADEQFIIDGLAHCQMEPYVALASYNAISGKLDMWMPHQSPFTKQKGLSNTLKMPLKNIRVLKSCIGGAFGGRSEVSPADFCAALLSMQCGRPVKICYSREETFVTTRQKHPWIIDIKMGVDRDGKLLASKIKILADGGAYNSTGQIAISVAYTIFESTYRISSLSYQATRAYTNNPIRGAMKGHGIQQFMFALESVWDILAEKAGMDPLEIRLKNIVKKGEKLNSGSQITSCHLRESLVRVADVTQFKKKWRSPSPRRGIGISCSSMISGFNLGFRSGSTAYIKFNEEGEATLFTGTTDNGQGNDSMMVQVAAEGLGISMDDINLISADTDLTPLDPGSYSMCAAFVSANAVKAAAADARRQIFEIAADRLEANILDLELRDKQVFVKGSRQAGIPVKKLLVQACRSGKPVFGTGYFRPDIDYFRDHTKKGRQKGQMTGAYSFGAAVAEVEVDSETGVVKVLRITTAQDCGFAINPMAVEGQMEGSVGFALGQALFETLDLRQGQVMNASFFDYKLPLSSDMPEVCSMIVESNDPNGPYGAKEAAEAVHPAALAAIVNAIANALGIRPKNIPITPEKVKKLLAASQRTIA